MGQGAFLAGGAAVEGDGPGALVAVGDHHTVVMSFSGW